MSFMNPNGSFEAEAEGAPVSTVVPLTGATINLKNGVRDVYIAPAATIASLLIPLPQVGSGRRIELYFTQIVTAITWSSASGAPVTALPSGAAVGAMQLRYVNKTIGWVRWR